MKAVSWRSTPRRAVVVLASSTLVLTGCTQMVERHGVRMFCDAPNGSIGSGVVLMAQAVPGASLVPCINVYPAGWALGSFEARTGRVVITFDSDRAGMNALTVTFEATCHPEGSTLPSDVVGAPDLRQRTLTLEPKYRAIRYYTFPGGCMLYRFDFPSGSEPILTTDSALMVQLIARSTIEAQVRPDLGFSL